MSDIDSLYCRCFADVLRNVMSPNFEEWMKMTTDDMSIRLSVLALTVRFVSFPAANQTTFLSSYIQKIDANSSWNFALIDHVLAAEQHRQLDKLPTGLLYARLTELGRGPIR